MQRHENVDEAFRAILAGCPEPDRLQAIIKAYELALDDPQTKIPSYLMAAIEAARK